MIEAALIFFILLLLLILMLSPLESLSWWAGWSTTAEMPLPSDVPYAGEEEAGHYIVFLTGIGGFSSTKFLPEERAFLDQLADALPYVRVVDDVYPYTTRDLGLEEGRPLSWLWRSLIQKKQERRPVGFVINLRNLLQVLVSADPRYGLIYSEGIANIVLRALHRHHYRFGSGVPVTLIGYSGGGEMAISAVNPLKLALRAPVRVISLGGVMGNDPSMDDVDHLYHLYGRRDRIQQIGAVIFPGRWRWAWRSAWNRARLDGRVTPIYMGDIGHNGPGGYLDAEAMYDGETHLARTVRVIRNLVLSRGVEPAAPTPPVIIDTPLSDQPQQPGESRG